MDFVLKIFLLGYLDRGDSMGLEVLGWGLYLCSNKNGEHGDTL